MSVQGGLAAKFLLTYLVGYLSVHVIVEILIQRKLADEVLLAVTATKLGVVEGFEVLDHGSSNSKVILHS